jgi:amidohydrolase
MQKIIQTIFPYFRDIRRQIHTNPELRYEENQTAELVAKELKKIGLTVQTEIGKTGVVGLLDSGKMGKTVALRAEMDALPITEISDLPYRSKNSGKMHACGHDGHTATLLATAYVLNQLREEFSGKIKFIFQPAEEGGAGAKAMINDGVLENPKVDVIFCYHNHPSGASGTLITKEGCLLYGNTDFVLIVRGKGGHAATPNLAIDPITIAANIVQNIPLLMRELADSIEPTIVTVTQFNSGVATNVIPDTATLAGTIRASSTKKTKQAQQRFERMAQSIAQAHNADTEITWQEIYPPTINPPKETEWVLSQARQLLGQDKVKIKSAPTRASEDFSFFLQKIPGCYFMIGNSENSPVCHSSQYDFNDEILPMATEVLATLAINYLNEIQS